MAKQKDTALEEIQRVLSEVMDVPLVTMADFLIYGNGKFLPGIGPGGQIMTRAETRDLPTNEALSYRMAFIGQYMTMLSNTAVQPRIDTQQSVLITQRTA